MNTKKIAVILSGCGYLDGSEITEAVSTLIALSELGCTVTCFAPDVTTAVPDVAAAIARSTSGDSGSSAAAVARNALTEANRIARGTARPLAALVESDFDAIVFPGGFGAANVLSNWATDGAKTSVLTEVRKAIVAFHRASKPIGAICIAPVLVARVLGAEHPEVTIGNDPATATELEKTGAVHTKCAVDDYVSDRDHKILTTPAYMIEGAKPHEVFTGIRRMLTELVEMA